MSKFLPFLLVFIMACSTESNKRSYEVEEVSLGNSAKLDVPERLSEWNLFKGKMSDLVPVDYALQYDLNTPLFTDYAYKSRFIVLPKDSRMQYNETEVFGFPDSTILVKTFYYPSDFRNESSQKDIIETRLLVKEKIGWNAWTYVWNEDQTDAILTITGKDRPVSWIDKQGELKQVSYSVPNLVQCKSCHEKSGRMTPIGPKARNLNRPTESIENNLLVKWAKLKKLDQMPSIEDVPMVPVWEEEESGTLAERARAWLDVNCAHCHSKEGPAKNSGLYLTYNENDPYKLGINKPPVAAGSGSKGLRYAIFPGSPEKSILYQRIISLDPGVMMPELGRKTNHEEGIAVVKAWIQSL
jgi:uncharacterized repeat protein (TIGR03806 family)